jgi:cell wall-associated NlpC family hydrolase
MALAALMLFAVSGFAATGYGSRTLSRGSHGPDVKQLQRYLRDLGISAPLTGYFGSGTIKAVDTFERREGQRPDGKVTTSEARTIAEAAGGTSAADNGGASAPGSEREHSSEQNPTGKARISSDGRTAIAPDNAPTAVKKVIAAANRITDKPYRYGGGHGSFNDSAYDCSGSVSYALHGAGLVSRPYDSTDFESWGKAGMGRWITVWTNSGHAYMIVAGLRFDTAGDQSGSGPRWHTQHVSSAGFMSRHPSGL